MKPKLIKKGEIKPAPKPAKKAARRGGPGVDPRVALDALFAKTK